jgi:hypothetical protein
MGEANLQRRMALEHAAEHQARGGDGGVERIADQIGEIIRRQAVGAGHVDRMEQNERIELRRRRPNRLEFRIIEVLARDIRADLRSA